MCNGHVLITTPAGGRVVIYSETKTEHVQRVAEALDDPESRVTISPAQIAFVRRQAMAGKTAIDRVENMGHTLT